MTSAAVFSEIPDFFSWPQALEWIKKGQQLALQPERFTKNFTSLDWEQVAEKASSPLGLYALESWRKWALSIFLADLASYPAPADQVTFERLLFVLHTFPKGFRTWWMQLDDATWWPVGYTGWYPMFETAFELLAKHPETLKDRTVVPNAYAPKNPYLYLFNYSAIPALKKSDLSKAMMQKYSEDVEAQQAAGLSCITVSEDGVRVARRFGMSHAGNFEFQGSVEGVYVKD